jgi:hypothetical protein
VTPQQALRDSQGRLFIEDADMAGEPETAGMGEALAVAYEEIRFLPELLEALDENGDLPKGEKPGDVRKGGAACGGRFLEDLSFGPAQDDGRGEEMLSSAAVEWMPVGGHVESRDEKGAFREPAPETDAAPKG